jgi:hypothetical protein
MTRVCIEFEHHNSLTSHFLKTPSEVYLHLYSLLTPPPCRSASYPPIPPPHPHRKPRLSDSVRRKSNGCNTLSGHGLFCSTSKTIPTSAFDFSLTPARTQRLKTVGKRWQKMAKCSNMLYLPSISSRTTRQSGTYMQAALQGMQHL